MSVVCIYFEALDEVELIQSMFWNKTKVKDPRPNFTTWLIKPDQVIGLFDFEHS